MLQSRFFWKLYFTFAGLVLLTTAGTGFLVHQQSQASLHRDLELKLLNLAHALSPFAEDVYLKGPSPEQGDDSPSGYRWPKEVQELVVKIAQDTDTRITFVAPNGEIVADSHSDPYTMENHSNRPEIVAALTNPYGVSRRFSETVRHNMLYVALVLREDADILGTVRVSIPLVEVAIMLRQLRTTIGLAAALGVLLAMGVGLVVARRITLPVTEMTSVAEALLSGAYDQRVELLQTDEFGTLGATLNRLADELTKRISTLAEQRAQLGAMVAGLHEGVIAVNDRDHLIFSNEAANQLLGLSANTEANDKPLPELAANPGITKLMAEARSADSAKHREVTLQRGGTDFVLDARATPFTANLDRGIVVVLYDITNLRRLEKLRTDFVANVSHELKTPLTAIAGFVDTLSRGAIHDDENNLRFLNKIEQQVLRLDAMVSDLLSLAQIEAEEESFFLEPVHWMPVVDMVIDRYRDSGALEDFKFVLEAENHAIHSLGQVEAMMQILDNLLNNAIKYTPKGGEITVRVFSRRDEAVLEVEDAGIGIATIDQERIFERFFCADKARSRASGGTGLGLSIVKHLVQKLSGAVEVESELGKGSLFRVVLQLDKAGGKDSS
tara:strand:- start:1274 stop:3109 length:1836 start_codon:yes stop_codon:yes gene_type:complete